MTDVTVVPVPPAWAKTTSTSPTFCGRHRQGGEAGPDGRAEGAHRGDDGAGTTKVKWSAGVLAAEVPPAAVTVTSTVAADSAGEVTVIEVAELTTTPVPATVPNFTPVTPVKPVPVMVTRGAPGREPGGGAERR